MQARTRPVELATSDPRRKLRILLIDVPARELLVRQALSGHRLERATGTHALRVAKERRHDVWLVRDPDFVAEARRLDPNTPAILLGGTIDDALRVGAVDRVVEAKRLDDACRMAAAEGRRTLALRRRQERYRGLVEAANQAVWEWDLESDLVYLSGPAWRLYGERAVGRYMPMDTWMQRIHEADREALRGKLSALLGEGDSLEARYRITRADGLVGVQTLRGVLLRGEEGEAQRLVGSLGAAQQHSGSTTGEIRVGMVAQLDRQQRLEQADRLHAAIRSAQEHFVRELEEPDPASIFGGLVELATDLTASPLGFIAVLRGKESERWLEVYSAKGRRAGRVSPQALEVDPSRCIVWNQLLGDDRATLLPFESTQVERFLGVPIVVGEQLVGLVGLGNRRSRYSAADGRFLSPFLDTCGAIILQLDNHSRRRQAERDLERRDRLLRAGGEAAAVLLEAPAARSSLEAAIQALGVAAGASMTLLSHVRHKDKRVQHLPVAHHEPEPRASRAFLTRRFDMGSLGLSQIDIRTWRGSPLRMLRQGAEGAMKQLLDRIEVDSVVVLPIETGGRWWGALWFFGAPDAAEWTPPDLELLSGAANNVGAALALAQARRALMRREARFRALVQASGDVIAVLDEAHTFTYCSPAAERLFGASPEALAAKRFADLLHHEDVDAVSKQMRRVAGTGESVAFECRLASPAEGGEVRTIAVNLRDATKDPEVGGYILNVSDLTDQRALWQQLLRAQKMESIGRLAGGIAHDFNNTIAAIRTCVEFIRDDLRPDDPIAEDINEIDRAAERATQLTRRILTFSRKQPVRLQVADLAGVGRDLQGMLERLVPDRVRIQADWGRGLPLVELDVSQFEQALVNLVVNAKDAMPSGGDICISLEARRLENAQTDATGGRLPRGGYVVCAVSDQGVGLALEEVTRAFEPFYTTKPAGQGTGLGLATVYGIVKMAKGGIMVRSEPGRGATFELWLPETQVADSRPTGPVQLLPVGTERLVLLEDDPNLGRLMTRLLSGLGYEVELYDRAAGAIAACDRGDVDLLVCDIVLPDGNGIEIADGIVADHPDLPVLFSSGYAKDEEMVGRALVRKPFTRRSLARAVRQRLDRG